MANTINTTAINNAVTAALRSAHAYASCVEDLKKALKGVDRKDAQNIVTPAIGKFYGVATEAGERGVKFDETAPKYEAAKKARSRLLASVYAAAESAHREPAVKRFNRGRVDAIAQALNGLDKAQARAYFAEALKLLG